MNKTKQILCVSILSISFLTLVSQSATAINIKGSAKPKKPHLSEKPTDKKPELIAGYSCSTENLTSSSQCQGIYDGNNSKIEYIQGFFNIDNWGSEIKVDSSSGKATIYGGRITLNVTSNDSESSGTWSLSGISLDNYNVMAVLKGGPTFSAYLLDSLSGTWNNYDLLTGGKNPSRGAGLSHFSIYTSAKTTPPQPVPEPLTILGTGLALGLGGLFKSKQKQKSEV